MFYLFSKNLAQCLDCWTQYDSGNSRWLPCYNICNRR